MADIIRADKFFSIWIFIYTIAYIFKITPYNPIILICIALTFFVLSLFIIIYNLNKKSLLFYYIMINTIAKIIPLFIIIDNIFVDRKREFTTELAILPICY